MVKIPEWWIETTLKQCVNTNEKSITKNYLYEKILYLDTWSITENKIEWLQEFLVNKAPSRAKRLVKDWDIIYSTVRPNQKHFWFIKNPQKNLVVSTWFAVLSPKENSDWTFIYYYITQDYITEKLHLIAEQAVSTYPSIKPENIENLQIYLPPLPEQQAIASVLSSLDDKIELLREENQTLEEMGQTLFKEWFISPLAPWRGNWTEKNSSDSKKEKSPLGDLGAELPDGWKEYELSELVDTINWYSYKWDELVEKSNEALVTLKSFDRNWWFQTRWFKEFSWTPKKEHEVFIWDLVVAHTDLTQDAEVLGNPAFIVNDWWFEKLYITMDLVKVEPKNENISKSFLYFLMKTREFKWHCVWYSNWTTVLHLSKKAIPEFKIVLPKDLSWLKEKSVSFDLIMRKISHNFFQIDELTETRDQLLPKLMSWEVRVEF